jgi:hypothetical protein
MRKQAPERPTHGATHGAIQGVYLAQLPVRVRRYAKMEAICNVLDELQQCNHCKMPLVDAGAGVLCLCCGRVVSSRELRDSTVDSLVDYTGMDAGMDKPSPFKPCPMPRGPPVTMCNSLGHTRFAGAQPNLNVLTPEERANVIKGMAPALPHPVSRVLTCSHAHMLTCSHARMCYALA